MPELTLSPGALSGHTGLRVRVAVVDSGIHAAHPHVQGISGGVALDEQGETSGDIVDRLGHGTAVAAAIREKAPACELLAIKVFDRTLATTGPALVHAISWAANHQVALINLSLGTTNPDHEAALAEAVRDALSRGAVVIAAAAQQGARWLPGTIPGVIAVDVDWSIARDACAVDVGSDGRLRVRASGYPRPIPGVPPERNLKGLSFAVANATGLLALVLEGAAPLSGDALAARLMDLAAAGYAEASSRAPLFNRHMWDAG